ncbi:hypothetical protein BOX15_Mlig025998g3 [Macrostomum lignano]|uniref:Uncharacterized protein n=1 Tax=Macrostomum lignano TaxID=282301 RepID=A0A267G2L0_9PLAT|nr:hypothetical protein BOX15_Mlig025998g3 [Macrostomum lignano]
MTRLDAQIATLSLLLQLLLPLGVLSASSLRPSPDAQCICNFTQMDSELKELYRPGRNHAEMVFSFVHTLISLNFKLTVYLNDFRGCIRFWLDRTGQCEEECSCSRGLVCCRDSSLNTLESSALTLKGQVKSSFTAYSHIKFLNDYQSSTFDIVNVFSSAFFEFINLLKEDNSRAQSERQHYLAFYKRLGQSKPLETIFAQTMPVQNSSQSIVLRIAEHYHCDTTKVLPFYLNVYGVVLQYLFMSELHNELMQSSSSGQKKIAYFSEEQQVWKNYLRLADNMTKHIIFCSTKEIRAIRSQEIKEKDMAMRNAAIVFSSFLIILIIIIALIAVFACKTNRQLTTAPVTIRDEPVTSSDEFENRDLLYKRHYESDETV